MKDERMFDKPIVVVLAAVLILVFLGVDHGQCLTITPKYISYLGRGQGNTILVRVFFEATDRGRAYLGSRQALASKIFMNGIPLSNYQIGLPSVVVEDARTPVLLVLAIDVSGSMGGMRYQERMGPLRDALTGFIDIARKYENLWVSLVPFGHECPHPLGKWYSTEWGGRCLRPADPNHRELLITGIEDMAAFVQAGKEHKVVDTGLWFAMFRGAEMVKTFLDSVPDLSGGIGALVLLTDGKNDLVNYPDVEAASYDTATVNGLLRKPECPPVHAICFGSEAAADEIRSGAFRAAANKTSMKRVNTGKDAASELLRAYHDILARECKTWYIDIALPPTFDLVNPVITGWSEGDGKARGSSRLCMLFLPSPLRTMSVKDRLLVIGISGLGLLIICNVWYIARYRLGRSHVRSVTRHEALPPKRPLAKGVQEVPRGMSVQEWERRKKRAQYEQHEDSQQGGPYE